MNLGVSMVLPIPFQYDVPDRSASQNTRHGEFRVSDLLRQCSSVSLPISSLMLVKVRRFAVDATSSSGSKPLSWPRSVGDRLEFA